MFAWQVGWGGLERRGRRREDRKTDKQGKEGEGPTANVVFVNKSVHLPLHREPSSLHNAASSVRKTRQAGESEESCKARSVTHNTDGAQPPGNDR